MPTNISSRRIKGIKRQKMMKRNGRRTNWIRSEERRGCLIRPISSQAETNQTSHQPLTTHELAIENYRKEEEQMIESKRLANERFERDKEIMNPIRADKWTGLRVQPDSDPAGRNWMTYFCLRKKYKNIPSDIMINVNQFLNWVPAGCWNNEEFVRCQGGCGDRFLYSSPFHSEHACSMRCHEKILRNRITNDYDYFVDLSSAVFNRKVTVECLSYAFNLYQEYDNIAYVLILAP